MEEYEEESFSNKARGSSDGSLKLQYISIFNSESWMMKNFEHLEIINCPTIKTAEDLLTDKDFCLRFISSNNAKFLTVKVKEEHNSSVILRVDKILRNRELLIMIETPSGNCVFWKSENADNYSTLHFISSDMKDTYKYACKYIKLGMQEKRIESFSSINTITDHRGFNLLKLAAECGDLKIVTQLISLGFDTLDNRSDTTAAELAWKNDHPKVLPELLKADSFYPNAFREYIFTKEKRLTLPYNLRNFVDRTEDFFNNIKQENLEAVSLFLKIDANLSYRRLIFNFDNVSAAATAIKLKKFKVYEILLEHNISMAPFESMQAITVGFNYETLKELGNIHSKFAKEHPFGHIKILSARSKTSHDNDNVSERMEMIEKAYEDLDRNSKVREILIAVAKSPSFSIYYDFNRTTVNHMDPNFDMYTNGAFYSSGRIYIAAKDLLDPDTRQNVLAVIIHELCHFALSLCFRNRAKPYEENSMEEENFCRIYKSYLHEHHTEPAINDVFMYYNDSVHHAELIVRAPQLLVLYQNKPFELEKFEKENQNLLDYYECVVYPKIQSSIPSVEEVINDLQKEYEKLKEEYEAYVKMPGGKFNDFIFDSPVHMMEIRSDGDKKEFLVKYGPLEKILKHKRVKNRKVVVVSIIGEYRKGKSFFLDYCLRFMYANYDSVFRGKKPKKQSDWMGQEDEPLKGFSWKHGRNPDTKGILFWPDAFLHKSSQGEIAVILMDTQGLFEINSTHEVNSRIFGLSTLISSIQILNTSGVMREDQIEHLEMATSLTKFVSERQSKDKVKWKPFQKLLFLIRDWTDEDIEGGFGYAGGETYLTDFLNASGNSNEISKSIRKNIHNSFEDIKCFLLNHPGSIITKKSFNGEWSKLDPEFRENLKTLVESILKPENSVVKSVFGKSKTANELLDLIRTYFKAFRDAKLPNIENILQMTIDAQMKTIVQELLRNYRSLMNEDTYLHQENIDRYLIEKHDEIKKKLIRKFDNTEMINDKDSKKKFRMQLEQEMDNSFDDISTKIMQHYTQFQAMSMEIGLKDRENQEILNKLQQRTLEFELAQQQRDLENEQQRNEIKWFKEQFEKVNLSLKEKDEENKRMHQEYEQRIREQNEERIKEINNIKQNWDRLVEGNKNAEKVMEVFKKNLDTLTKQTNEVIEDVTIMKQDTTILKEKDIKEEEKKLRTTGIWMLIRCNQENLPEHAVEGGCDENGITYVARCDIQLKPNETTRFVGYYSPRRKTATFYNHHALPIDILNSDYKEVITLKYDDKFEILTHTNFKWVPHNSKKCYRKIEAGVENDQPILIARNKKGRLGVDSQRQYIGSIYDRRCCFINDKGKVEKRKHYEVLRLANPEE